MTDESTSPLLLDGESLTVDRLAAYLRRAAASDRRAIQLQPAALERAQRSHERLREIARGEEAVYGINTGFGPLCTVKIPADKLEKLQENLLVSHAFGTGRLIEGDLVRLMLVIKINSLLRGASGVSLDLLKKLALFVEEDLLPCIPEQGSVGASGDLAPLSHLGLGLLGLGKVHLRGEPMTAADALHMLGLSPHRFLAKEALALINGTQFMSAHAVLALARFARLAATADVVAAISLEALLGSVRPFDARIAALRPHPGHATVAANVRRLMLDSEINASHANCGKVQDPYSLRCVPQVHGASRDAAAHARAVTEIEINAATDNPLLLDDGTTISGGNFHGQPLALVLDYLAIAIAELASISERRIYLLVEGRDGLPKLLLRDTGLDSGFMIPQYTAAALVSENKVLCHPASVDSIPTSLGQEDHVSMGSIAGVKALRVLENAERVLAIEAMTAAQALDFRAPLKPGRGVGAAHTRLRQEITHAEHDRLFVEDLARSEQLVRAGALVDAASAAVGAIA